MHATLLRYGHASLAVCTLWGVADAGCGGRVLESRLDLDAGTAAAGLVDAGQLGSADAPTNADVSEVPSDAYEVDASLPDANPAALCATVADIFVIAGDDYVYSGAPMVIQGGVGWSVSATNDVGGVPAFVGVSVGSWMAEFSTVELGTALAVGDYTNAQRAGFEGG